MTAASSSVPPHAGTQVGKIMQWVLLALLPGVAAQTWFFGWQTLLNIFSCMIFCTASEIFCLYLLRRDIRSGIGDCSALVTAVLLGVALPTLAPWWLAPIGSAFAICIAKYAYGGLGQNIFNPAMAGYALLLVCFPLEMTLWPGPRGAGAIDGMTMATALDVVRENHALLMRDLWHREPQFGTWGGRGWEWVNIGFLAGGLFLLHNRYFTWHAPVGMLAALMVCAAVFYDNGSSASGGSPLFHLFSGATMLGAFFIVTDPVTAPVTRYGRLIGGIGAGILIFLLRHSSNYPDGIAFAILLMNLCAPLLDMFTQPRVIGHRGHTGGRREN